MPVKIIIIAVLVVASLSSVILYTGNDSVDEDRERTITNFSNNAVLLADSASAKLDQIIRIIEMTSVQPVVRNTEYATLISESYRGIPQDEDTAKRQIAKDILKSYPEFEVITFNMPNGDFYLMEPYADQINMARLNFADRDWYEGVMSTQKTYVSEVYESTTTHHNVVAIRTPVYDSDGALIGIWGGNINVSFLQNVVSDMSFDKSIRILFFDQYNKIILDTHNSDSIEQNTLQSIVNEHSEKFGTFIVDDPHLLVSISPITFGSTHWKALIVQSYSDAFPSEKRVMFRSSIMITSLVLVVGFTSFFTYNMFRKNVKLTAQLRKKDTDKEEFSAMITHELKTPLIPISGYSELFLDGSLGSLTSDQKEKMRVIYENSIRMTTLIQDILDARKLDLGRLKLDLRVESLKDIVSRCIDIFRPITEQKNITITDKTSDIRIKCDPDRILQVLSNIISNAIKFVPAKNGTISINSRIENNSVVLSINDNGTGIPKEKQRDLFQRFYQVDKTLARKSGGTGLGLAISRGIIESHGGKIWVESEQNQGTTVHFTLPIGVDN